jgi:glucan phosphoethanolaminetransferase (alkaline phosphatase superfamily)
MQLDLFIYLLLLFIYLFIIIILYIIIIICKYTVAVFRHTRRGSQILLRMIVSHHVVAGIWTLDLQKSSRVLLPTEPSHQPAPSSYQLLALDLRDCGNKAPQTSFPKQCRFIVHNSGGL